MISLLLAAALAAVVLWRWVASLRAAVLPALPGAAAATRFASGSPAGPDPLLPAVPDGRLTVVAVAVDEIAATAPRLGEAFATEARAEVAEALRAAIRRRDLCTPWRDQMVVAVLPGVDVEKVPALRLRVQRTLSELRIVTHAGEEIPIGFRVASACAPEDGATEAELLAAAEQRLSLDRPGTVPPVGDAGARLRAALPILSN